MKITSFNPLIVSRESDKIVEDFKEMGFEVAHCITVKSGDRDVTSYCMKDAGGFRVDVAHSDTLKGDLTLIRMNVDDFDEALAFLLSKGFKDPKGDDHTVESATNKSKMLISPSGFAFDLCQHIK